MDQSKARVSAHSNLSLLLLFRVMIPTTPAVVTYHHPLTQCVLAEDGEKSCLYYEVFCRTTLRYWQTPLRVLYTATIDQLVGDVGQLGTLDLYALSSLSSLSRQ
jgi:hypothetical protein